MNSVFKRVILGALILGVATPSMHAGLSEIMSKPVTSSASVLTNTSVPLLSLMLMASGAFTIYSVKSTIELFKNPDNKIQKNWKNSFGWKLFKLGLCAAGAIATFDYAGRTYQSLSDVMIGDYLNSPQFAQDVVNNFQAIKDKAAQLATAAIKKAA